MEITAEPEERQMWERIPLFSYGFRPFFLAGALTAALIPLVTALAMVGLVELLPAAGVVAYHSHEMLFGYLGAVIAGFLLTAVPNWTGTAPIKGGGLVALVGLWMMGRLVMLAPESLSHWSDAIFDCLFLFAIAGVIGKPIMGTRNWRNFPVLILILRFPLANLSWHLAQAGYWDMQFSYQLALSIIMALLTLIGGRITPNFTRNWLRKNGQQVSASSITLLDKLSLALLGAACLGWCFNLTAPIVATLFGLAAAAHFMRLMQWEFWRVRGEPLVLILHIGYAWLPISMILLAQSQLAPAIVPASAAIHAITAGAIGVMTLAVMTRATLGHTGRALAADKATVLIYALINIAAIVRVGAALIPSTQIMFLTFSSLFWAGAFLLFAFKYGRYLVTARE